MNAVDVLRDMVHLYAAFDSYRDTGYVTTTFVDSGVVHRRSFSTLYQQPRLFRFAFLVPPSVSTSKSHRNRARRGI